METIFENHCTYTFSKYHQLKRTLLKQILVTGYVLILISLAFLIFGVYKDVGVLKGIGMLGIIFFAFRSILSPMWLAYSDTKRDRKMYKNHHMETLINFYDDHLLAVNALSGSKTNIKYADIQYVKKSSSLYIIGMEQNLVLLVDKKGFTKGTKEEFCEFIKEKCENAEVTI